MIDENQLLPHYPQNRATAQSKLRRSGVNCPICLSPLKKNARRTKRMAMCIECQAHPSHGKMCTKCGADAIWENQDGAACQRCGLHGKKAKVIR
jgi:predicted amidophosphoribosyltransferase